MTRIQHVITALVFFLFIAMTTNILVECSPAFKSEKNYRWMRKKNHNTIKRFDMKRIPRDIPDSCGKLAKGQ